jgi:hypothetical protein
LQKLLDHLRATEAHIQELQTSYTSALDETYVGFLKRNTSDIHTKIRKLQLQTDEILYDQHNNAEDILQYIS